MRRAASTCSRSSARAAQSKGEASVVARPPAALVAGFVEGDAVDPGAQAGVSVEGGDVAEDLDEDFLGDIGGVGRVAQAAGDEGVERTAVLGDEQSEGLLGAGLEVRDEALLVCPDADRAG